MFADPKQQNNNVHQLIISRDGKKEIQTEGPHGGQGGLIDANYAGAFDSTDCPDRFMPINAVRCYFSDKNYVSMFEGIENIDGHPCYKVAVRLRPDLAEKLKARTSLIVRYWFDLERGGHAIKIDDYANRPAVHTRLIDVTLRQFKFSEKDIWLPVEGKYQMNSEDGSLAWTEYYQVLQASVRISELPPDRFKAKFKPGTPITDQLRKARYEFGQDIRAPAPSRAEAEKRLREQIGNADDQKATLDASRTANEGYVWLYPISLGVTATCVIIVFVLLIRRR